MTSDAQARANKKYRQTDAYRQYRNEYMRNRSHGMPMVECECGTTVREHHMKAHVLSMKHINYVNNLSQ